MEIQTKDELHNLISNESNLILIDFFATWCGPCKMLSPILEEVADELKDQLKVVKVDVDKHPELSVEFKISAMPTLVFIKNQKEIGREVGYMTKDDIIDLLKEKYL